MVGIFSRFSISKAGHRRAQSALEQLYHANITSLAGQVKQGTTIKTFMNDTILIFSFWLETLLKFFPVPAYRNLTLQCLSEVAALSFGDFYNMQYIKMYNIFMVQLQVVKIKAILS